MERLVARVEPVYACSELEVFLCTLTSPFWTWCSSCLSIEEDMTNSSVPAPPAATTEFSGQQKRQKKCRASRQDLREYACRLKDRMCHEDERQRDKSEARFQTQRRMAKVDAKKTKTWGTVVRPVLVPGTRGPVVSARSRFQIFVFLAISLPTPSAHTLPFPLEPGRRPPLIAKGTPLPL